MQRVYWWMSGGLLLTGGIAWLVASSPQLMSLVRPLFFPILIAELVVVFAFSFLQSRVSGPVAAAMFLLYAALNGLTFSMLFLIYQLGSIASAFVITAGAFGAMSLYGTVTKKDLSSWSSFLMMGLSASSSRAWSISSCQSDAMSFVMSCAAVVVFAGSPPTTPRSSVNTIFRAGIRQPCRFPSRAP